MGKNAEANGNKSAEALTKAILMDLETTISGSPEVATMMINSSMAAVEVLIHRYGIRKDFIMETYDLGWQQAVDKIVTRD